MIDFTSQVAIVTGAGRGLGRVYALDFARRGASVVVNDVDAEAADLVAAEIGRNVVASYDSVATPEGGAAIVDTAWKAFGRVDAVISNAGIFNTTPFDELSVDQWNAMRSVHLDGAFHLSQPAFGLMKAQGYGRFVFVASSAGAFGQPDSAHYAAAKSGVIGLANVVAIEGEPHGIRANCVLPFGYSRMVWDLVGPREALEPQPGFLHAIEPELVVPIVTYLASRDCAVTHHNFSACAGRIARVFMGLAEGSIGATSAEDIAVHLAEVTAAEPFSVPTSIIDEVMEVSARLGL